MASIDDPWINAPAAASEAEQSGLRVETIEGVAPLDRQFGIHPKKSVPDALHDALFGQPAPTEAEIEAAGGVAAAVPSLQTYAILDAAKVVILPELLDANRLEHRCLFKGAAYDELKNVAPWIVRLEEGNHFTRSLFTGPEGINGLWETEPGFYIRSRATLDELWGHFRKFTRVQNPAGKWYYLRFWDKSVLNAARREGRDTEFYQKLVNDMTIIWHSPESDMPNRFSQLACEAA